MKFDQLIESLQPFVVKCVAGPIWSEEYKDREVGNDLVGEEYFIYICTLNGKKIIIGEENEDQFRFVAWAEQKTYDLYSKNKKTIAPLIAKAIKQHEQKQRAIEQGASEEEADTITKI